jgi:hypothetical protein
MGRTEATQCNAWHSEASFLANLWQGRVANSVTRLTARTLPIASASWSPANPTGTAERDRVGRGLAGEEPGCLLGVLLLGHHLVSGGAQVAGREHLRPAAGQGAQRHTVTYAAANL